MGGMGILGMANDYYRLYNYYCCSMYIDTNR